MDHVSVRPGELTIDEIALFRARGFLLKRNVLTENDLAPLRRSIDAQLDAECRHLIDAGLIEEDDALWGHPFETRFGDIVHRLEPMSAGQKAVMRAIQDLFLTGRYAHQPIDPGSGLPIADTLLACIRNEKLLGCVTSLIGPDIVGSSTFRIRGKIPMWEPGRKLAYFPGEVPWHQDAGYMLAHCDAHMIVTCWIPLVEATIENGCMHVLPWRFEDGVLPHYYGRHDHYIWIPEGDLPSGDPVPVEMTPGDVLLLHNMTPHATFDNNSTITRWSMDLRYGPFDMPNNVDEDPATYTADRPPHTMACAPTEADFIVRDTRHPDNEIRDGTQFAELRMRYARQHVHPGRGWKKLEQPQ